MWAISSHLDETSLVNKRFTIIRQSAFSLEGPTREILSMQDTPILPAQVAYNHNGWQDSLGSSWPLVEAAT